MITIQYKYQKSAVQTTAELNATRLLRIEGEDRGLITSDEEGGWQVSGHDVQPGHVQGWTHGALARHWQGPGKNMIIIHIPSIVIRYISK